MHERGHVVALLLGGVVSIAGCTTPQTGPSTASDGYQPEPASDFHHIHGLAVDSGDPRVLVVATHVGLIKGFDGGNWTYAGPDKSDYMGFTMHPTDNRTAWSSGHPAGGGLQGVRKTMDGGRTWATIALQGQADCHGLTVSRADPDLIYCAHSGTGLYRAENGRDFERVAAEGLSQPVIALATPPGLRDLVYAANAQGLQRSENRGGSWQAVAAAPQAPSTALAIDPLDGEKLYAYFVQHGLLRSTDGGASWLPAGSGLPADALVTSIAIDPSDPRVLYAAAVTSIFKSADGAGSWTVVRADG